MIAKSGAVPVPVSVMGAGLAMPLTRIVILAVREPIAVGANVTLRMQLDPAATWPPVVPVGQVVAGVANAKSPAFAPLTVMLVTLSGAPPLLVRVTVCAALVVVVGWLVNVRLRGEGVAVGGVTPVPERFTVCAVGLASSVNTSVAENGLAVGGVKVTLTTHDWLTASVDALMHVVPLAIAKSVGFVPPSATVVRCSTSVPVFVSVTVCAVLVVVMI